MRKPKLRELGEAVKALVCGPVTTAFPYEPHEPPEAFRGRPTFHEQECVGCCACAEVCPTKCIDVIEDLSREPPVWRLVLHYDKCIFCGHCELNCTTSEGIRLSGEYDLACFDRSTCTQTVENELVLCTTCGAVIGAKKHLLFVADRLGARHYANPTLLRLSEERMGRGDRAGGRGERPMTRDELMEVTCPRCRRTLVLQELWGE